MDICFSISNVDWKTTKDIFSIIGTIGALIIACVGLSTWRKQLAGTNAHELAEKAILLTYEWRQTIQGVRDPMVHLSAKNVESGGKMKEEQRIYHERMQLMENKWVELQTIRFKVKILWDEEAFKKFENIAKLVKEMRGEIWMYFWLKGAYAGPSVKVDKSPERVISNGKIVYFNSENDDFSQKINEAVSVVEKFLKTKILN